MKEGIESFKAAVMTDCEKYSNCFSENGCTKERNKCTHDYCGKYKWVIDRAKHYAEKTGKTVDEVMTIWETDRTYWYMNYYQECNQPELNSESIVNYEDWLTELKKRFGNDAKNWAFKCPSCGNIQTANDFIKHKIDEPESKVYYNCIGRYVKGVGCDWSLGGFFNINKVSVMKDAKIFPVFEMADSILA